jgi:hypothetical protein
LETTAAARFGNASEAIGVLESAVGYLADADHADLPAAVQAEILTAMERVDAVQAAVRGRTVSVFTTQQGYSEYAQRGMTRWLVTQTKVTKAAALANRAWGMRAERHPLVVEALAEGAVVSESWARVICRLSDDLPESCRGDADAIMIAAARAGVDLEGLLRIGAEIKALTAPPDEDQGHGPDRYLRLETTLDGAGVLTGDLSPECRIIVQTVLESLMAKHGPEDDRTHGERMHDALHEAMKRLLGTNLLPPQGGKPVTALVHINFADLCAKDSWSALQDRWISGVQQQWAAERAGASVAPGDGGAWLAGPAAAAVACDAILVPVVIGHADLDALDGLVELCVQYHQQRETAKSGSMVPDRGAHAAKMEQLQKAIIGRAVALMSGPGGLASFLRRNMLGDALAGPSMPLDVGDTDRIPWQIRRAVTLRDRHCAFPGGCDQPAAACEPHHTDPRAIHGKTSLDKLATLCWWHHHIVIHTWGWTVKINPDGTMTARKPDGTIFPNHSPPPRPG